MGFNNAEGDMSNIDTKGMVAGGIVWGVLIFLASDLMACSEYRSCDSGDFLLFVIIAVGLLGPSWIVTLLVSSK